MDSFSVSLDKKSYRPGEVISGQVAFSDASFSVVEGADEGKGLSVRLIWFTSGKGDRNFEMVDSVEFPFPTASASVPFQFMAPHRPLSFSGKLISLQWAVEVVLTGTLDSGRCDFDLSDDAGKLQLTDKSEDAKALSIGGPFFQFGKS